MRRGKIVSILLLLLALASPVMAQEAREKHCEVLVEDESINEIELSKISLLDRSCGDEQAVLDIMVAMNDLVVRSEGSDKFDCFLLYGFELNSPSGIYFTGSGNCSFQMIQSQLFLAHRAKSAMPEIECDGIALFMVEITEVEVDEQQSKALVQMERTSVLAFRSECEDEDLELEMEFDSGESA